MPEATGKLLWDVVALRLSSEAANQAALVGRAKDLLGAATIAATITGVLVNDKLFEFSESELITWWAVATGSTLAVLVFCALAAMRPRGWSFAPDAMNLGEQMEADTTKTVDDWYRDLALGYLRPRDGNENALQKNRELIEKVARFVTIETYALGALAIEAFALAIIIANQQS